MCVQPVIYSSFLSSAGTKNHNPPIRTIKATILNLGGQSMIGVRGRETHSGCRELIPN